MSIPSRGILGFILIEGLLFFFVISCSSPMGSRQSSETQFMVVYPNSGNMLYLVDYNTYEIAREITVEIPDSLGIDRMCLSTDKDFFVFAAATRGKPPFSHHIISYSIDKDSGYNIFPTGLDSVGAPRMTAAHIPDEPGLIYLYSHNVGLYAINFLTEEVEMISTTEFSVDMKFHHSSDKQWIVITRYIPDYTEIEFYDTSFGLNNIQSVLNENDRDSVNVKDLAFSEDNKQLYISYLLSQRRAVGIAAYFGSYDLETKKLNPSRVTLPWSVNPYYIAYSPKRHEAYLVGAQDKFYIVDTSTKDYRLKAVVNLTGKVPSPSEILLGPDENVAFVSCIYSNFVIAIDLDQRQILKKIELDAPMVMILL
ncbi:MAG: hypothetical protein V1800_06870 [Candidatus Latescibacterota bacterium]